MYLAERPSVNNAKDWLDQFFLFAGLVCKTTSPMDVITRGHSTAFFCVHLAIFGMVIPQQPNNRVIPVQACPSSVKRQSFAMKQGQL